MSVMEQTRVEGLDGRIYYKMKFETFEELEEFFERRLLGLTYRTKVIGTTLYVSDHPETR